MRSLAVASLLALAACEQRPAPADDRAPPPVARATQAPRRVEIRNARAQIRTSLSRPLPAPKRMKDSQCADLGSLDDDERLLSLRVVDARYDKRWVLPMRVTRHLTAPDLNQLEAVLAGADESGDPKSALAAVARFSRQRFIGAYHVIHYESPKWVVRADSMRPRWNAGRLDAWFAIHEAATGIPRCAARLTVIGNAEGAPVRARLRSDTRDKLTTALGVRAREATRDALARIAPELKLPGGL